MSRTIEPQAKLIAALADTMRDGMWTDDILQRCAQIEEAAKEIRRSTSGGVRPCQRGER